MMETEEDCELDLSGIDDDEIDMVRWGQCPLIALQESYNTKTICCYQFLLNDDEVKIKTFLWTKANADYLKELKGKRSKIILYDDVWV